MKILFVALPQSIHTARWINQLTDEGWKIALFPASGYSQINNELNSVFVFHHLFYGKQKNRKIKNRGIYVCNNRFASLLKKIVNKLFGRYQELLLYYVIKLYKPDIIHTLETQTAGYLLSRVKSRYNIVIPTWIHSVWGSDLFLYSNLPSHKERLLSVMKNINYLVPESENDINLFKKYNSNAFIFPKIQATGGLNLDIIKSINKIKFIAKRKTIMLKGYQGWAGRALCGMRALERANDILKGYEVIIFSNPDGKDIKISAELFSQKTGVPVIILPNLLHNDLLHYFASARISIGLSISDGVPNSLLESMALGAFPIQSYTSAADEWIIDGVNGFLVPPEDPEIIEKAIRTALVDDALVEKAADINKKMISERLDYDTLKEKAISIYKIAQERFSKSSLV